MTMLRKFRAAGVVAALIAGLALSACASKQATDSLASGAAVPGSQQDFVVNVGDRVFFETDQT
jgi:peptidoglycan-associated lipoprotein